MADDQRFKVTTPVAGYSGVKAGVRFVDGEAEVGSGRALSYFQRHGYTVEPVDGEPADDGEPKRPAGNASRDAWAVYAAHLGVDKDAIDAAKNRGDVVALVDAHDKKGADL